MLFRLTNSQKLSLVGSGILTALSLIIGLGLYAVTGPTIQGNTSSPLQLAVVVIIGWAAIYTADRINTNKKKK